MVTVQIENERPIDREYAARLDAALSARMGAPMKQVPNALADIEYSYEGEGFRICVEGVPVHRSSRTGRVTIHARIGKTLRQQVDTYAHTARHQIAQQECFPLVPRTYEVRLPDFLHAA